MSSSAQQRAPPTRSYPQDYIARIRYNNALPPPTNPPKLLDIPNTAFAQYTDPTFASQLARAEAINVEADSELGMALDLVPAPRVFEGDDSALRALDPPPPVDPRDRALVRPAAALGKPATRNPAGGSNVSFLRRTEYISAEQARSSFKSTTSKELVALPGKKLAKQRPEDADPVRILAAVMRGFDVANPPTDPASAAPQFAAGDKAAANAERNWRELKHPNRPGVRAVETFPLLPHLDGSSDTGGYMVFKFQSAPTDDDAPGRRDARVDASLFQPVDVPAAEATADLDDRRECFDFYIPASTSAAQAVKRKFRHQLAGRRDRGRDREGGEDADRDADAGDEGFRYDYVRRYETKHHRAATAIGQQPDEVALCLHAGDDSQPRGAYFYPVMARYTLRPRRKVRYGLGMSQHTQLDDDDEDEEPPTQVLKLRVRELDPAEKRRRVEYVSRYEGVEPPPPPEMEQQQHPSRGGDDDDEGEEDDEDLHDDDEDAPGEDE